MVGRIDRTYKPIDCYSYAKGVLNPYPVIKLKLYNLVSEVGEYSIAVDTGFEGSLLIPSDIYREYFLVGELPRSMWRLYKTLTGQVSMRVSRGFVEVAGMRIETYVETPLYGGFKFLIGRELLNKLRILLDGLDQRLCIVESI